MASYDLTHDSEFVNILLHEDDISRNILYDKFISIKNDHPVYKDIDFDYFRSAKIKNIGASNIQLLNELFIHCKRIEEIDIFPVLAVLSEKYIEASKLKVLISSELRWIIIEELRENGIVRDGMESTTLEDFC